MMDVAAQAVNRIALATGVDSDAAVTAGDRDGSEVTAPFARGSAAIAIELPLQ